MNYLQLVQRFRQETNYDNSGPTTVASQTGDHARAVSWVADAYTELQGRHLWRWLRKGFTVTTSSGTDSYDYTSAVDTPTSLAISRFKSWVVDPSARMKIYLSSAGVGTESRLTYLSWERFCSIFKIGSVANGAPSFVTIDPSDNLVFGPTPNDTYVVTGEYNRSAQILSGNTDTPEMPSDYHMLIVYLAMEDKGYFDVEEEVLKRAHVKGNRIMRALEFTQLPRMRKAGPLA